MTDKIYKTFSVRFDDDTMMELRKLRQPSSWIAALVAAHIGVCPTCGNKWKTKDPDEDVDPEKVKFKRMLPETEQELKDAMKTAKKQQLNNMKTADTLIPVQLPADWAEDFEGPSAADLIPDVRGRTVSSGFQQHELESIHTMAKLGLEDEQMAVLLNIEPLTFDAMIRRAQLEFEQGDRYKWNLFNTIQRGKATAYLQIADKIWQKGVREGDVKMLAWLSKVRLGWREKAPDDDTGRGTIVFETQVGKDGKINRGQRRLSAIEEKELDMIIDVETGDVQTEN